LPVIFISCFVIFFAGVVFTVVSTSSVQWNISRMWQQQPLPLRSGFPQRRVCVVRGTEDGPLSSTIGFYQGSLSLYFSHSFLFVLLSDSIYLSIKCA
jgi:hypothetical protein